MTIQGDISQFSISQLLQEESVSHDANLQYRIADCYFCGTNETEKNYEKAVKWLEKAAQNNHAIAQFALASCYSNGYGVPKNPEKAFEFFNRSAKNGNAQAFYSLAQCYEKGLGVKENLYKATYFYLFSIIKANSNASENIKQLYSKDIASKPQLSLSGIPHEYSNFKFMKANLFYTSDFDNVAKFLISHKAIPEKDESEVDFDDKEILEIAKYHKRIYGEVGKLANLKGTGFSFSNEQGCGFILYCSYTVNKKPFSLYLFCFLDSEKAGKGFAKKIKKSSKANQYEISQFFQKLDNEENLTEEDYAQFNEALSTAVIEKPESNIFYSSGLFSFICLIVIYGIGAILFASFFCAG